MLKIRLSRIGTKKKPFYRVVAVDERAKRTGGYLELLGTYNPLTEPKEIKLKKERIDYWIKQGAVESTGFLRIIGKAPQRPPRKPKKERKEEPTKEEKPAEEPKPENQQAAKPEEKTPEQNTAQETAQSNEPAPSEPVVNEKEGVSPDERSA